MDNLEGMTVKIKVSFTLDVNADSWCYEYGITPQDVRADVQSYFEYMAKGQLCEIGCNNDEDDGRIYHHPRPRQQ